jgi:hypothetical protein
MPSSLSERRCSHQVVNKQRSSIAADMWSYGMLIFELASGLDITLFPPLAMACQVGRRSE